jgi:hypothetical protein
MGKLTMENSEERISIRDTEIAGKCDRGEGRGIGEMPGIFYK